MSITLSIFLLFYSVCGQELGARAGNDLEAVFRLEDELEARPFLLESGEKYRDLLTITAARNVGEFGIIRSHSQPGQTTVKTASLHHSGRLVAPPRFLHAPALQVAPVYQTDREIFDFTDSRFIKPFPENLANYPLILRSSNDVKNLAPSQKSSTSPTNDLQGVYTSFSPPVSHRPASEISLGSRESSKPSKFLSSVLPTSHDGQSPGSPTIVQFSGPEAGVYYEEAPEGQGHDQGGIHVQSHSGHHPGIVKKEELPGQETTAFKSFVNLG